MKARQLFFCKKSILIPFYIKEKNKNTHFENFCPFRKKIGDFPCKGWFECFVFHKEQFVERAFLQGTLCM
jgi:hypothetical protein